jgi:hypothetical protein
LIASRYWAGDRVCGEGDQEGITVDDLISGLTIEPHTAGVGAKAVDMRDGSLGSGRIGEVVREKADPITDMQARLRHGRSPSITTLQCKKRAPGVLQARGG